MVNHCTEIKINPCFKEPCLNNATCIPISTVDINDNNSISYTGFTCKCDQSYNGSNCETLKTPCHSSPCQNFGTCENSRDNRDYNCKCFSLFTGKSCESSFNPCAPNPCLERKKVKSPSNLYVSEELHSTAATAAIANDGEYSINEVENL